MAKSKTPSFITEVPLKVDSQQERELLARLQAARQLYNACLDEAMVRMQRTKDSSPYRQAKKMRGGNKKQRRELFLEARKQNRFSEYEIGSFATATANASKWMADNLGAHEKINMGARAFKAAEKVLFSRAKECRFKVPSRFRSVEGKTNGTGPRFVKNQVLWKKLAIEPIINWANPVMNHGLNSPIKYCRILWRNLNGKKRWFVQLINQGLPYCKPQNYVKDGTVGLDLNISNVAFVGDEYAGLLSFAENIPTYERDIKACQRQMQRSGRMHNPDNFEPDFDQKVGNKIVHKKGKVKKGKKQWIKTRNYRRIRAKKAELERRKAAYTKSHNRKLVNEILRHGNRIKTESVSVKGWQKLYGKAICAKSPGFFQSELARKAESAGGQFIKFSTQTTALSQTHLDGSRHKKKLSERVHRDVTGTQPMHRDLFSAYLARCVYGNVLSLRDAQWEYPDTEPYLLEAWQRYKTNCEPVAECKSKGNHSPSEQFSNEVLTPSQIASKSEKLG